MLKSIGAATAALGAVLLSGCASLTPAAQSASAPQPLKRIDVGRFYAGLWHEIGRRPMSITDGCVAGATRYGRGAGGEITVLDSCQIGTPEGEAKTIGGPGTILDPGFNAKLRVDYTLAGIVPIQQDYWVLDRADDYSWFISADPTFRDLFIFTRSPAIGPAELRRLVNRARSLGYDVSKLEFPAQPRR